MSMISYNTNILQSFLKNKNYIKIYIHIWNLISVELWSIIVSIPSDGRDSQILLDVLWTVLMLCE